MGKDKRHHKIEETDKFSPRKKPHSRGVLSDQKDSKGMNSPLRTLEMSISFIRLPNFSGSVLRDP